MTKSIVILTNSTPKLGFGSIQGNLVSIGNRQFVNNSFEWMGHYDFLRSVIDKQQIVGVRVWDDLGCGFAPGISSASDYIKTDRENFVTVFFDTSTDFDEEASGESRIIASVVLVDNENILIAVEIESLSEREVESITQYVNWDGA